MAKVLVKNGKAYLLDPVSGDPVVVEREEIADALSAGLVPASQGMFEDIYRKSQLEERYGGVGGQLQSGLMGALGGATFGLSDVLASKVMDPEKLQALKEVNPWARGAGEVVGMLGSTIALPGGGAVGAVSRGAGKAGAIAGKTVAEALGRESTGLVGRLVSGAVREGTFGAAVGTGQAVSDLALAPGHLDPMESLAALASGAEHGTVYGVGLGALGAAATKAGRLTKSAADKISGNARRLEYLRAKKVSLEEQAKLEMERTPGSVNAANLRADIADLDRKMRAIRGGAPMSWTTRNLRDKLSELDKKIADEAAVWSELGPNYRSPVWEKLETRRRRLESRIVLQEKEILGDMTSRRRTLESKLNKQEMRDLEEFTSRQDKMARRVLEVNSDLRHQENVALGTIFGKAMGAAIGYATGYGVAGGMLGFIAGPRAIGLLSRGLVGAGEAAGRAMPVAESMILAERAAKIRQFAQALTRKVLPGLKASVIGSLSDEDVDAAMQVVHGISPENIEAALPTQFPINTSPEMKEAVTARVVGAVRYLQQSTKPPTGIPSSAKEARETRDKLSAVISPESIIEDFGKQRLTVAKREAFKAVYPEAWKDFQAIVKAEAHRLLAEGHKFDRARAEQLGIVLDDWSLARRMSSPGFAKRWASMWDGQRQAAQKPVVGRPMDVASRYQTPMQGLMGDQGSP